eukprot:TRINITY_DN5618_c2_g1_i1.p1 TRINITY_DN5618_c2_g1~~TRINITY_DN5618_c2_g1_i1.p1  ORF type:complete len:983 (+),score=285.99 TRINITY_DN5618_c2_g1_i1:102-3050(+)
MAFVSVRNLTILLALVCVAVTAAICTGMAVDSGDRALDTTKTSNSQQLANSQASSDRALESTRASGAAAVDVCFQAASANVRKRTDELLLATAAVVTASVTGTLGVMERQSDHTYRFIASDQPVSRILLRSTNYGWSIRRFLYTQFKAFTGQGMAAQIFMTFNDHSLQVFESGTTIGTDPSGFHHIKFQHQNGPNTASQGTALFPAEINQTADFEYDGPGRLPNGGLEHPDCRAGQISPRTGQLCQMDALEGCREGAALRTQGERDDGWCPLSSNVGADTALLIKTFWAIGRGRWTPMLASGGFLGAGHVKVFGGEQGEKVGMCSASLDLRSISSFLSTLEVGGAGARGRIFMVIEKNWLMAMVPLPDLVQGGDMLAVSHGNATTFRYGFRAELGANGWWQVKRPVVQCIDPLIRGAARHVDSVGGYGGFKDAVTLFPINSSLTGGGWTETAPGPRVPTIDIYGAPQNETIPYVNGRTDDPALDPLAGYARDGEEFFVSVNELLIGDSGDPDMNVWLAVLIDREYVLGEIDRSQAATRKEIQESNERVAQEVEAAKLAVAAEIKRSNEDVQETLDKDRAILYSVIAGSSVVLMVMSVLFVAKIVAPIQQLQLDMHEVALMKLEHVDEGQTPSALAEVAAMQASFLQMIRNLREFRSYMPASVLVDDDEEEDEEPAGPDEASSISSAQRSHLKQVASRNSNGASHSELGRQESTLRTKRSVDGAGKAMGLGLHKKKAVVMSANVTRFSFTTQSMSADSVLDAVSKVVASFSNAVQQSKGVPDGFNADRFYATWGAVRPVASAKTNATLAAKKASTCAADQLSKVAEFGKVTAAVSAGDVMCGNMGTQSMRKFCCIGAAPGLAHMLVAHCNVLQTAVLVDSNVGGEVQGKMFSRLMPPVRTWRGVHKAFEVLEEKSVGEDEWMYQLEEGQKNDPNVLFNDAMQDYYQDNFSDAIQKLVQHGQEQGETAQHRIISEMAAAAQKGV